MDKSTEPTVLNGQVSRGFSRRNFMTKAILSGAGLGVAPMAFAGLQNSATPANENNNCLPDDNEAQKTALILNTHLTYPGMSAGTLNKSFCKTAKASFLSKSYKVLETKIEDGYDIEQEVEKHMQAEIVILQTPVNWISTPWIYKKYIDEVFTSALKSQKFLSGDGRVDGDPSKQYGTGGKMKGRKFMICATWNAAEKDFNDKSQYLYGSKSPADVFYNITTNYRFSGYDILSGYNCFDVFHNKHIKSDLDKYPAHLATVLAL